MIRAARPRKGERRAFSDREVEPMSKIDKPLDSWREELTEEQFHICRLGGTERAFSGEYHATKTPGSIIAPAAARRCSTPTPSTTPAAVGRAISSRWTPRRSANWTTSATACTASKSAAAAAMPTWGTSSRMAPAHRVALHQLGLAEAGAAGELESDDPSLVRVVFIQSSCVQLNCELLCLETYPQQGRQAMSDSLLSIPCTTIKGEQKTLADFGGKALLVVNTASKCGFTRSTRGWRPCGKNTVSADWWCSASLQPVRQAGTGRRGRDFAVLRAELRGELPAVQEDRGQRRRRPPVVRQPEEARAGPARQPGHQVELHQVPDRPRWPGGEALRADHQAGGAEFGDRGAA